MLSYIQAILLGGLQGITELFPVSSLGHSVILPQILGWQVDQSAESFVAFLIATHLATALVLFFFFFKDWMRIIAGVLWSIKQRKIHDENFYGKLGWLIIVGTIPAGIIGLLFEQSIKSFFASPRAAAVFLILNGLMLWGIEIYKKRKNKIIAADPDEQVTSLSWASAVKVGIAQCLALIPGFSRTGATLGGGLYAGLDHASAARYSFLLATPIIMAAAVLKLPELFLSANASVIGPIIAGSLVAALCAYLSVKFLTRYFKSHTLLPFAIYCMAFGIVASLLLL